MVRIGVFLAFVSGLALSSTPALAQESDPWILRAIVQRLHTMQTQSTGVHGLWIRRGVFELSRHRVLHSFDNPVREWTASEKAETGMLASDLALPLQFCGEGCGPRPDSIWTVSVGSVREISDSQIAVPVQVEGSEGKDWSYKNVYEMMLDRAPGNRWVVSQVLPGAGSDSVSCQEAFGHSCEEERQKKARQN